MVVLSVGNPLNGDEGLADRVEAPHVTVSLLSETIGIQPGVAFTVGLRFELENHWHVYWLNPGDSGQEPRVTWRLPEGFQASELRWPAPRRIPVEHMVNFGYEGEVVLLAQITPPGDLPVGGKAQLSVDVDWLVCEQQCIPGAARLGLVLPVEQAATIDSQIKTVFDIYRDRLPVPSSQLGWQASAQLRNKMLAITLTPPEGQAVYPRSVLFFPEQTGLIDHAAAQTLSRSADSLVLLVYPQTTVNAQWPDRLRGILVGENGWAGPGSRSVMRINIPLKPR